MTSLTTGIAPNRSRSHKARRHPTEVPPAPRFRRPPGIYDLLTTIEVVFNRYHDTLGPTDRCAALVWLCTEVCNRTARRAGATVAPHPTRAPEGIHDALAEMNATIDSYLAALPHETDRVGALCWLPWWAHTRHALEADRLHPTHLASDRCATASTLAALIGGAA